MEIRTEHEFRYMCVDPAAIFKDCCKFNTWFSRTRTQSIAYGTSPNGEVDEQEVRDYRGAAGEQFVEALIRVLGAHISIGVDPSSIELISGDDDYGVDMKGIGYNGKIITIQVKWRNVKGEGSILTANNSHLCNFRSKSVMPINQGGFGVDQYDKCELKIAKKSGLLGTCNMIIIHFGEKIDEIVKQNMLPDVREINRAAIKILVDDNRIFWDAYRKDVCREE